MFCTTECWDCEDKSCEHYRSKRDLYFENKKLKGVIETYEILIKANNINNWNELKKWLEEFQEDICYDTGGEYFCKDENMEVKVQVVLDKMQELEGK